MIKTDFLQEIGLTADQIQMIQQARETETKYRSLLIGEGVSPKYADLILNVTDHRTIDLGNEDLLRVKIRLEYGDFIVKKKISAR